MTDTKKGFSHDINVTHGQKYAPLFIFFIGSAISVLIVSQMISDAVLLRLKLSAAGYAISYTECGDGIMQTVFHVCDVCRTNTVFTLLFLLAPYLFIGRYASYALTFVRTVMITSSASLVIMSGTSPLTASVAVAGFAADALLTVLQSKLSLDACKYVALHKRKKALRALLHIMSSLGVRIAVRFLPIAVRIISVSLKK